MNDNAIEKRTKLRLEGEAEHQQQLLEDLKLEKRLERSQRGAVIRVQSSHHSPPFFFLAERQIELDQMVHKLDMVKQQHAGRLQEKEAENQLERQHMQLLHEDEIKFYQQLKEVGGDVTQIMVAQQRNPDKLIQIVNDKEKKNDSSSSNIRFVDHI